MDWDSDIFFSDKIISDSGNDETDIIILEENIFDNSYLNEMGANFDKLLNNNQTFDTQPSTIKQDLNKNKNINNNNN